MKVISHKPLEDIKPNKLSEYSRAFIWIISATLIFSTLIFSMYICNCKSHIDHAKNEIIRNGKIIRYNENRIDLSQPYVVVHIYYVNTIRAQDAIQIWEKSIQDLKAKNLITRICL